MKIGYAHGTKKLNYRNIQKLQKNAIALVGLRRTDFVSYQHLHSIPHAHFFSLSSSALSGEFAREELFLS